ncbi:hypothetical protein C8R47DRAFT_659205 [Mycena vitilis]|nr:hypothetical protein C8R47DRAFT_659205 [Mycena vitilis]
MALPAELYNLIFEECVSDKALVAAWSLVSKDHLVSTRFHLFSSVRLDHHNAHEFARILAAPSCDIVPLVQQLVLSNRSSEYPWFSSIVPRLPLFPNVTTLCLHNSKSSLSGKTRHILHKHLPAVTSLEIVNFSFTYRTDAIEFACGFTALEALVFYPKVSKVLASATRAQIPGTLRTFALRCAVDDQPNWFLADLAHPSAPPLSDLRVREAGARDFPVLAHVLARLGESLDALALDFSDTIVEAAFMRNYFLKTNTQLRRLELTLGNVAVVEICVIFLRHVVSAVLEEVVLDIWVDPACFAPHPWEALDAAIANGPAGMAIRRVELRVGTLISWPPLAMNIRRRMPLCDEMGVLRVRIDDGEES